ncbi:MAG: hypothetical protein JWM80_4532, partial [Cyanobacteria bacterium RYN_339]|nr:hypothetical protein [Cyanobacteria bacterium RYN_339]
MSRILPLTLALALAGCGLPTPG